MQQELKTVLELARQNIPSFRDAQADGTLEQRRQMIAACDTVERELLVTEGEGYLVGWLIDMEADSPEEAAARALIVQRDPESVATVFQVTDKRTGESISIDLAEEFTDEQVYGGN